MKIGVWLGYDIKESAGGAFSYTDKLIQLIDNHTFPQGIEICFVNLFGCDGFNKEVCSLLSVPRIIIKHLKTQSKLFQFVKSFAKHYYRKKGIKKSLEKKGIKLIYYLHQGECIDSKFPFIATNWDIGHRSTHAFPELIWDGKPFEEREWYYRNVLPKALMVFCESMAGVEEIVQYTNIGLHKLRILPMFGGSVIHQVVAEEKAEEILDNYSLTRSQFFFYPAQFWAHKNHKNLIEAFAIIHERYPHIKLVLSGSDKGNKSYIEKIISDKNLTNSIVFLGFVPVEVLFCMYKYAIALVMPSHFGPTNMPPIEAMEIGCPVACSDLGGHHEILGNAAIYFDSFDSTSMVNAMIRIYEHNDEYREKIAKQKEVTNYSENKAMETLDNLLLEAIEIRSNWN